MREITRDQRSDDPTNAEERSVWDPAVQATIVVVSNDHTAFANAIRRVRNERVHSRAGGFAVTAVRVAGWQSYLP